MNRNLRLVYLTLGGVVQRYTRSGEHLHDALSHRLRGHNIHPACSPGRVEPIGGEAERNLLMLDRYFIIFRVDPYGP